MLYIRSLLQAQVLALFLSELGAGFKPCQSDWHCWPLQMIQHPAQCFPETPTLVARLLLRCGRSCTVLVLLVS